VWTAEQRNRMAVEHQILQREGFTQFSVWHKKEDDTYYASGYATSSSGRPYYLYCPLPSGYPIQRPPLYLTEPRPLLMADGSRISALGVSHAMHTLAPLGDMVQICHWRDPRWHAGIVLQKVFLKGLLWIEAYEQHLATGQSLADFAEGSQAPQALNITADDADMFATITLSSDWLRENWQKLKDNGSIPIQFSSWDGGDALTQSALCMTPSPTSVDGVLFFGQENAKDFDKLAVFLTASQTSASRLDNFSSPNGDLYTAKVWAGKEVDESTEVVFADVEPQLELRRFGILETSILKDKTVLCIGLGTGGAHVAIELAKCGVGKFSLVDRDRLSVGNVVRHPGGICQVGRSKVNVVRDLILEKNPNATVEVKPLQLSYETADAIGALVQEADLVVCGTDNRQSKLLVNSLCVQADVPAIYGGAFRRAYGGQILRVRPKQSPCHQCFVAAMPEEASDVEISSEADASDIAYSDRPMAVEPGLSIDVLPIATMLAKLALLELVADQPSLLNSLKRDFDAPWYLWINRPEPGTQYANWPPLSESSDEMTINRWYGIYFDRDEACPVCGDFVASLASHYGLDPADLPTVPASE
jgi:molybdopterin/thiamine biosynthesis adenylyltransferase